MASAVYGGAGAVLSVLVTVVPSGAFAEAGVRAALAPAASVEVSAGVLVEAIAGWTAHATGLPHPGEMPQIAYLGSGTLERLLDGRSPNLMHRLGEIVSVYDAESRTIYLPRRWTGANVAEISVLVHEMVHHLQTVSEQRFACAAERERDAMAAQELWLESFGESLESAFGIDPLARLVGTNCMF